MKYKEFIGKYIVKSNGLFSVICHRNGNLITEYKTPSVFVNFFGSAKGARNDPNSITGNVGKDSNGNNLWTILNKKSNNISIISKEDYIKLIEKFNSFRLEVSDTNGHYRSEDGVPKMGLETESATHRAWWRMTQKYPDKKFIAYKCNECGFYHVGKDKNNI